jgi:hypothetical protein
MKTIVRNRINDPIGMNRKVVLGHDDPRRVSYVLAPIQPPPTADLVAQEISMFSRDDADKTLHYTWTDQ